MRPRVLSTGDIARYDAVFDEISQIVEAARRSAARSSNAVMTAAYWLIGRHVVELDQRGERRAEYGKETVERLAADLSARYSRGFSVRDVWLMRAFYVAWPNVQTPSAESRDGQICFIGRRRHLRIGNEWYRVDLFFHRRFGVSWS